MSVMRLARAIFTVALLSSALALGALPSRAEEKPIKHPSGLATLYDRTLKLNGVSGALRFEKGLKGKGLVISELVLSGVTISDPSQKCEISIVSDTPIETKAEKDAPGAPMFKAEIPACPLVFLTLSEAVLTPGQDECVFTAADCRANPSGMWGPEPQELASRTEEISKQRERAEKSISASLAAIEKVDKDMAAQLASTAAGYEAARDQNCGKYADEATHGFCRSRADEARAIALRKRLAKAKKDKVAE